MQKSSSSSSSSLEPADKAYESILSLCLQQVIQRNSLLEAASSPSDTAAVWKFQDIGGGMVQNTWPLHLLRLTSPAPSRQPARPRDAPVCLRSRRIRRMRRKVAKNLVRRLRMRMGEIGIMRKRRRQGRSRILRKVRGLEIILRVVRNRVIQKNRIMWRGFVKIFSANFSFYDFQKCSLKTTPFPPFLHLRHRILRRRRRQLQTPRTSRRPRQRIPHLPR